MFSRTGSKGKVGTTVQLPPPPPHNTTQFLMEDFYDRTPKSRDVYSKNDVESFDDVCSVQSVSQKWAMDNESGKEDSPAHRNINMNFSYFNDHDSFVHEESMLTCDVDDLINRLEPNFCANKCTKKRISSTGDRRRSKKLRR